MIGFNQRFFDSLGMKTLLTRLDVAPSFPVLRLDLDVDHDGLADAGDRLSGGGEHQVEITSRDWIDRYGPARPVRLVERCKQFYMKRDRLGHAVYGKVAENVAALRASLFYTSALKCDLRKFFDIKKFCAAEMIVPLFDTRIDTAHVNLCCNGRIFRMLVVDIDLAIELCELSVSGAQELMHIEADRRARRIEPVRLVRQDGGTQASDYDCGHKMA